MLRLKAVVGRNGALSLVALLSVAAWVHLNFVYVSQSAGLPLNGFIQRATVVEQLQVRLPQREDAAIEDLRTRLSELRAKVIGRFEKDFAPNHQSTVQSAMRDANYWLKLARTWDREKAQKDYYDEINNRLKDTVITPANLTEAFEVILIDVSEKFLGSSAGVEKVKEGWSVAAVMQRGADNSNFAQMRPGTGSASAVRSVTFELLSKLSKYYVSGKDSLIVADATGPVGRAICQAQTNLCKLAIEQGYKITREGLKKAGVGIASTAAKAAGIANVLGAVVLTYEAYSLYDGYSQNRKSATGDLRASLDRDLAELFNGFCSPDGEFRRQLRIVGEKMIEERTSIWRLVV
jgi:hypothetical protein